MERQKHNSDFIGPSIGRASNKAKEPISKQKNKVHHIFRKKARMYVYQGVRNVGFLENLVCFVISTSD